LWRIVFPRKLFESLVDFLSSNKPNENGSFLLAHHYIPRKSSPVITITDVIKPAEVSWNYENEHGLEPSSSYINESAIKAEASASSLIFIHTHPHAFHPSRFSSIDEQTNARLFANLSEILPDRPLGSLVLSRHGICGVVFHGTRIEPVIGVRVSGALNYQVPTADSESKIRTVNTTFDRQVKAIGKNRQNRLQEMTVSIVGVGGTGSAVATQLARMGVKKLRLVDRDFIDEANVPRVYGSMRTDIGKPKVNALKKSIACFSRTRVESLIVDITKEDVVSVLTDSDVIFGCTDNLSSRSVLNDISVQYYIPLIDVGCRINLNNSRQIDQAVAKVQVVTPDDACLWCTGSLDGRVILQESFSDEEKKRLAKEGYYENIEKQPSIISLTTLAASIAIDKLLSLLGVFGEEYYSRTQVEVRNEFMISDSPEIKESCICRKRRGLGDSRKIL
jgi:hypothetical protein